MPTAHLVSTTSRGAIDLPPLSIRWREGWGERPRATLLPTGLPPLPIRWREGWGERPRATLLPTGLLPLPIGWGEGRGEGPGFLRPVVLTRFARLTAARGVLLDDGTMIALTTGELGNSISPALLRAQVRAEHT